MLLISFLSPLPHITPSCPMDPTSESSSVFSIPSAYILGLRGQLQCPCHSILCSGRCALHMASISLYVFYINYREPSNNVVSFNIIEGKKLNSGRCHCLCRVCPSFPRLRGLSLGTLISSHISKL